MSEAKKKRPMPGEKQDELLSFFEIELRGFSRLTGIFIEALAKADLKIDESVINSSEVTAVFGLLAIASHIVGCFSDLIKSNKTYSAAALTRQLIEIEYLIWSFSNDRSNAKKWVEEKREIRMKNFRTKVIRNSSSGLFPDSDYSAHCELGGHPTPSGFILLLNRNEDKYALVCDVVGHSWGIVQHLRIWGEKSPFFADPFLSRIAAIDDLVSKNFAQYAITNLDRVNLP